MKDKSTEQTYFCEFFNPASGKFHTVEVLASSYKEAVERAEIQKRRGMLSVWKDVVQAKQIPDAEALLFEMDANNLDSIAIKEGLGLETTYTRLEVEESIRSSSAIKKYRATKALKGELDY